MSTRATIAKLDGKKLTAIYLHFDGDLAGKTLVAHYTDPAKVDALLALGGLSCLGPEIGTSNSFAPGKRDENACLAYHRDRGEALCFFTGHIEPDEASYTDDQFIRAALTQWPQFELTHCYLYDVNNRRWRKWRPVAGQFHALCPCCGERFLDWHQATAKVLACPVCNFTEVLPV